MKEKTYINIVEKIFLFMLLIFLFCLISEGIKGSEKRECLKWQDWQEQYKLFTPGMAQYKQCERYNIILK